MASLTPSALPTSVRLTDSSSFPSWYAQLKYHARARGVWGQIDPESAAAVQSSSDEPPELPDSDADVDDLRAYQIRLTIYEQRAAKQQALWNWVVATVDPLKLELAVLRAGADSSLRALISELKKDLCPSDDDWKEQVRNQYLTITSLPVHFPRQMEPQNWLHQWNRAYANAVLLDLAEIKGELPKRDFLRAAKTYAHEWATRELENMARPNAVTTTTLDEYARWISRLLVQAHTASAGAYATLGGRSDGSMESSGYACPCKGAGQHSWKPVNCYRLRYALTGVTVTELQRTPKDEEVQAIRKRFNNERWKLLADELREQGWEITVALGTVNTGIQYPGSIQA